MFSDKVVCIAGASHGIGRSLAEAFAREGASLLMLSRSKHVSAPDDCIGRADAIVMQCDVSDYQNVQDAIASALARWGRIDILINAAAILGPTGELWKSDPQEWLSTINTNLVGTYNTIRAALPGMIERQDGKIINFAGGGAAYAYPRFSAYAASKAAVVRLTETVAAECLPHNISINVIAPGAIETRMLRSVREAGGEVRTVGTMDQVVDIVFFLASVRGVSISGRFLHAKDDYRVLTAGMPPDLYTLRRVQP